jgi:predicted dehydrogenase
LSDIRWGILGPGAIARRFAAGLKELPDAEISAVGARSRESADAFAGEFGVSRRHVGYAALAEDPEVDVIYISTPHVFHAEHAELCLNAGKPVLCEKPFAVNAREAGRVVALAREKEIFLMEGMWTRFFPLMERLRKMVTDGAIGEPRMLAVDFGFRAGINPSGRLFDPALGGGALLDVGVYCVSLSSMFFGPPVEVSGLAHLGETGVDEQSATVLKHEGGRISSLYTAVRTSTPQEATLMGTEGSVRIHSPWWQPGSMTVTRPGEEELIEQPFIGNGFAHEAKAVMEYLRAGKTESEVMPLDETLAIARTMDEIRAQWGLEYPRDLEERSTT